MLKRLSTSVIFIALCTWSWAQDSLISYVDPFIGTGGHGHTFPGATVPFGMVQLSPDNGRSAWDWCSGYHYSDSLIAGFSHMHLSGTGIGDWLDISVMPLIAPLDDTTTFVQTQFSHDNERASPGYYQVTLENGIHVELTATERIGYHRYTYAQPNDTPVIRFDLSFHQNWDTPIETHISVLNDSTLIGYRYSTGWANVQRVYFAARTSFPFVKTILNNGLSASAMIDMAETYDRGKGVSAQLIFDGSLPHNTVELKVALSTTSYEKALEELHLAEDEGFNDVHQAAKDKWEAELQKIKISSGNDEIKRVFYTALYHTALSPTLYADRDGEYKNAHGDIHTMPNGASRYTLFSLWDTFRALNPLFTLTQPEKYTDILNSMLAFHDENGLLPVWDLSTWETNTMTGYHAIPVLADAILKDWPGLDAEQAYQAMLKSAYQDIRGVPDYIAYGYLPQDKAGGSVTITLEYAFDDWCIGQVAKKLGKTADHATFMNRARSYTNLFDKQTGFMRAKKSDGQFVEPFDPFWSEHDFDKSQYIEGNAWQHSFFVPHDVQGLAKLYGSNQGLSSKLDALFAAPSEMHGENISPDASGFIGQYAHGNEPSHHIAYMYSYIGESWKTQERVRQIVDSMYHDGPDGYAGNEDAGQMSAWAVWNIAGLYPANPASGEYVFGSPIADETTFTLPNGKLFVIRALNNGSQNSYIQSATLNGKPYEGTYILHQDLLNGGELVLKMGPKPNKRFGRKPETWPGTAGNQ
ncbi:GH92 family glycosyl hydrolase [Parapedobacter koreensis]|uniref:Alpha-1,2-mannosidase, putative n=1 Tax=Parapedobacter koreensis TaxID=332977 RepID=A0A1H7S5Z8_9SPHI|nr:GH92 family glycosyl hydrolase [Parapedobacter koreensis]SEL68060.1 alpha-1,2-mannosidase, putative [Parapedobacter koreensis]